MLFFWYPWKYHILSPSVCCFFFLRFSIEYRSYVHRMFKAPVAYTGIILLSIVSFSSTHLRKLTNIFPYIFLVFNKKFFRFWRFFSPIFMKGGREWLAYPPPCYQDQSYLQLVTKYFKLTLAFMWNSTPREKFNRYFLGTFLPVLTKLSFWQGDWALGYHSMKFRYFPNIY